MLNTRTHPSDDLLNDFLLGKLTGGEDAEVEEHLAECPECQARAASAQVGDTLVDLLASAGTKLEHGRTAAPTPAPALSVTPSLFADTQMWDGTEAPPAPSGVPEALAEHPKYRVVRRIGEGGMGTVWLAEHTVMNRPVAVKVIRPDLLAKPGASGRFLREVRAAAKLDHVNIVRAYDAEPAGDSCLFVMEYVEGQSLADRLEAGPLPAAEACRAVRDAARGLAHAHGQGLVHRDVKPHNLIRAADGTVKVLDFGLAGVAAGEALAAGGEGLTGAGMVFGTPDYIAPEQIADPHAADARSDIYGLGCTFYHLLAGRPPFSGSTVPEKLAAQEFNTPAPIPSLAPEVAAVLSKMLSKRPEDRYQTAAEVAEALEALIAGPRRAAKVAEPKKQQRQPRRGYAIAAALLFGFVTLVAGAVVYKIQRDNQEIIVETDDPDIEVVMKRKGEVVRVTDRRSGQVWEIDAANNQIGLADAPLGLTLPLPESGSVVMRRKGEKDGKPVFTVTRVARTKPEAGDRELILGAWEVVAAEADGEPAPRSLIDTLRPTITFTAEKFTARPGGALPKELLNAGRGVLRKETAALMEKGVEGVYRLDPSRSPKTIDLTILGDDLRRSALGIYTVESDTLTVCLALNPDKVAERPTEFSSKSKGGTVRVLVTLKRREKVCEVRTFDADEKDLVWSVDFSRDGRRVLKGGGTHVVLYDRATGENVVNIRHGCWSAVVSPDGKQILTATHTGTVHLWDAKTGEQVKLSVPQLGRCRNAVFSPDGKLVASSHADGCVHVWNPATGEELQKFPAFHHAIRSAAFRPGRDHVLVVGGDVEKADNTLRLYDLKVGGEVRAFEGHTDAIYDVAVSADGARALSAGDKTVRLWDLETGKQLLCMEGHTDVVAAVAFCPGGKRAVSGGRDKVLRLWDLETGKEIRSFEGHTGDIISVTVSADGRFAATGSCVDKTVRLWRLPDAPQITKP